MISREQIKHLAKLARIELSEEEIEKFRTQIDKIFAYVEKLDKAKIGEKKKTLKGRTNFREDKVVEISEKEREELLDSSPWRKGDFLEIPGVFE